MSNSEQKLIPIEDLQSRYHYSIAHLRKLARDVPGLAHKIGRRYWFVEQEWDNWFNKKIPGPTPKQLSMLDSI